ncbi:hypothetical protein EVAR_12516_1 [Eumeta japonica]|uniref:Uncharacterized protein n=1 Tax=Eumeta variegata TaxID=151549 RepID=A0A4C1TPM1_EUMVA|nr:hypothetical protein EVAR_12516_1 [Eumeta japonica]
MYRVNGHRLNIARFDRRPSAPRPAPPPHCRRLAATRNLFYCHAAVQRSGEGIADRAGNDIGAYAIRDRQRKVDEMSTFACLSNFRPDERASPARAVGGMRRSVIEVMRRDVAQKGLTQAKGCGEDPMRRNKTKIETSLRPGPAAAAAAVS